MIKIAKRLQAVTVTPSLQWQPDNCIKHPKAKRFVKMAADTNADAATDEIKHSLKRIKNHRQRQ
ncbi:hypothetical protein NWI01_27170 [Nitrobacter winogradskyi]|uniref:Uncharacterized protein n=1 Tax=Nitrobacter winogradskyi TaxID=913 RepID=A0A4Y3WDW8_NITWI|nr:hypothetical protein NWI01_27170 [Nitrobacter winogradskyi]